MSRWTWLWLALNAAAGVAAAIDWQAGDLPAFWFVFIVLALIVQSLHEIRVGVENTTKTKVEY